MRAGVCGAGVPPAFDNGPGGIYDRVEYKYNRLGQQTEMKDQNDTVHQYEYDAIGRQTVDRVTLAAGSARIWDERYG